MDTDDLRRLLKEQYGIEANRIVDGARGFVAETFVVNDFSGQRFFVKYVTKPLFVTKIRSSIETQFSLYEQGFRQMCYPIRTLDEKFCVEADGWFVALFSYIEAPQSYDYDMCAIGRLEANLHCQKVSGLTHIKVEAFPTQESESFPVMMNALLSRDAGEPILRRTAEIFRRKKEQLDRDYDLFLSLLNKCKRKEPHFVVTHGDIGGNTLVKTPTELYLIDWDEIILAPAERDIWTLWWNPGFQKGYREIRPGFEVDEILYHYYIMSSRFTFIMHYLLEICGSGTFAYRQANLEQLEEFLDRGWIQSFLEVARAGYDD